MNYNKSTRTRIAVLTFLLIVTVSLAAALCLVGRFSNVRLVEGEITTKPSPPPRRTDIDPNLDLDLDIGVHPNNSASSYVTLPHQNSSRLAGRSSQWKCCADPLSIEAVNKHPLLAKVQDPNHNYACPDNPSNFSWFYSTKSNPNKPRQLVRQKWKNKTICFAGDSTSRQMMEQFRWEMPVEAKTSTQINSYYLYSHQQVGKRYHRNDILDLRKLHPDLVSSIQRGYHFLVFNAASWWDTPMAGHAIDANGTRWDIAGGHNEEWIIVNKTTSTPKPDFSFGILMDRAIQMMLKLKHPRTKLIWRSESHTNCPVGTNFRSSIVPVLKKYPEISTLNISQASCDFLEARDQIDETIGGPHLCFPSVALRHWLLEFQDQFLPTTTKTTMTATTTPKSTTSTDIKTATSAKEVAKPSPAEAETSVAVRTSQPIKGPPDQRFVKCPTDDIRKQTPQFIVVGAMKGGTSAVLLLLDMHADLIKATHTWPGTREVHYFDHTNNTYTPASNLSESQVCAMRVEYRDRWTLSKTTKSSQKLAYFEKSPSYMAYKYAASLIQAACPWTKILVLLRDPVDRAHSHYKHGLAREAARGREYGSLEDVLMEELGYMKQLGLSQAPTIAEFLTMNNTQDAAASFQLLPNLTFADRFYQFGKSPNTILHLSLYSHQVAQFRQSFHAKQVKVVPYEIFKEEPQGIVSDILNWVGVKDKVYKDEILHTNYHKAHSEHTIDLDTLRWLQYFFQPYNEELVDLLEGEDSRWRGLWDYGIDKTVTLV